MSANNKQVGGTHYDTDYQHWDFMCDIEASYLIGCATKYICRWRKKNGVQDLEKARHFIEKAQERGIPPTLLPTDLVIDTFTLSNRMFSEDVAVLRSILWGNYAAAQRWLDAIIEAEPTPAYVDQDHNE